MLQEQPCRRGTVLLHQRDTRPAVGVNDLAQTVAVSPVHDRHQRAVAVEQAAVFDQPLADRTVVGGQREQLLAQKFALHPR